MKVSPTVLLNKLPVAVNITDTPSEVSKLARPHTFMVLKKIHEDTKKTWATDNTRNDLFASYHRLAHPLAKKDKGVYADMLRKFSNYLAFSAPCRCRFSDIGILLFNNEFCSCANLDKLSLADLNARFATACDELSEGSRRFRDFRTRKYENIGKSYGNQFFLIEQSSLN